MGSTSSIASQVRTANADRDRYFINHVNAILASFIAHSNHRTRHQRIIS